MKNIKINSAVNLFYYQPLKILLTFLENFIAGLGWARSEKGLAPSEGFGAGQIPAL